MSKYCTFKECEGEVAAKSLCQKHYVRLRKGTLYYSPYDDEKLTILYLGEDKDSHHTKPVTYLIDDEGCWIMDSHTLDKDGYGEVRRDIDGVRHKKAHRASHAYHNGEIPRNMFVLHSCHKPSCINPSHLSTGTHSDNMQDRLSNGTYYEQHHGKTKFSKEQVLEIDKLLKAGKTRQEVSEATGVSKSTVIDIERGSTWTHTTGREKYKPQKRRKKNGGDL